MSRRRSSSDSNVLSGLFFIGIFGWFGAVRVWEFIRPHLEAIGFFGAVARMLFLLMCLRSAQRQQRQAAVV